MSLDIKGTYTSYSIQPDRTIIEKNDGTLEGQVVFKTDRDRVASLPQIGDAHPDDSRLEMYQRSSKFGRNLEVLLTASYQGLTSEGGSSERVLTYSGGQNNDPIETHPDFEDFAGTKDAPKNGAKFDEETGEFIGFVGAEFPFQGVLYYLNPSSRISISYWTKTQPNLENRMVIVDNITGFPGLPDAANYLRVDMPYRKVGNNYQVTEQYLASGPTGWNAIIYPAV